MIEPILAGMIAIVVLVVLLVMLRFIGGRNLETAESPELWAGREYRCPGCGAEMVPGWVMAGRGLIWSARERGMPGTFSTIAGALPNTISLSIRPASNQCWRCERCRLVLVDHSRLVARRSRLGHRRARG